MTKKKGQNNSKGLSTMSASMIIILIFAVMGVVLIVVKNIAQEDSETGTVTTTGNFAELGFSGAGMEEYTVSSQSGDAVKFSKAIVDPLDVLPGDNQTFTVIVYSPNGIASVASITELDNSTLNLDFVKISDDGAGKSTWSVSWTVNDTHAIEYRTKITVTDSQKNKNSITLTWTDSCQSQMVHGGDDTITTSCSTTASTIEGLDGGNLIIGTGVTVTLASGSKLIFNTGKSITITASGASIVSTSTGYFGNGNLYYADADGDSYAPNAVLTLDSGTIRAKDALGTNDCYDSNVSAHPGQTAYFTTDRGDTSFDYDCNTLNDKQYTTYTSACNTVSSGACNVVPPGPCTTGSCSTSSSNTPACGGAYTVYLTTDGGNCGGCYLGSICAQGSCVVPWGTCGWRNQPGAASCGGTSVKTACH